MTKAPLLDCLNWLRDSDPKVVPVLTQVGEGDFALLVVGPGHLMLHSQTLGAVNVHTCATEYGHNLMMVRHRPGMVPALSSTNIIREYKSEVLQDCARAINEKLIYWFDQD